MIGHDVVPHIDEIHSDNVTNTLSSKVQVEHGHSGLSHIFGHFQHSSDDRSLTYLTGVGKVIKTATKIIANDFLYSELENQELWHANRKKQRFRDYLVGPYSVLLHSYSLRGPPIC